MRSGSLRHPGRHFDWSAEHRRPRRWAGHERTVTEQDEAPDNGDWLSEFPAEDGAEEPEQFAPAPAPAARRDPLWTVIAHDTGPAWPAPPNALQEVPPPSRLDPVVRAATPGALWLRARMRDHRTAAAAIGAVVLTAIVVYAAMWASAPPPSIAETTLATQSAPPPSAPISAPAAIEPTVAAASAASSVTTRDRAESARDERTAPAVDTPKPEPPARPPASRGAAAANTATRGGQPEARNNPPAREAARPTLTPTSTPAAPRQTLAMPPAAPPAAAATLGTSTTLPAGQPVVTAPPVPPRPTPTPVATPAPTAARPEATRTAPPSAESARAAETAMVQSVLDRYRQGYSTLNADAVAGAWPSVNTRSLSRAFDQLESQRFAFTNCRINVNGTQADATCAGTASFVPKVGNRTQRSESREWVFNLVRVNDGWIIRRVESR